MSVVEANPFQLTVLSDTEVQITRAFAAPRALVWQAITDPAMLAQWWGPRQYTTTIEANDLRPGGRWRYAQRNAEGDTHVFHGEFRIVEPPACLSYTFEYEGMPGHVLIETQTLSEIPGGTLITMVGSYPTRGDVEGMLTTGMEEGARESWERMDELLAQLVAQPTQPTQQPATPELVITRTFAAPRALVWKAWTEAARLAQWWGPKGMTMAIARLDLRPGGSFHYSMSAGSGAPMWGRFIFEEITPEQRLVFTNSFSDEHGGMVRNPMSADWPLEIRNVITFEDLGDSTRLTLRGVPHNATRAEEQTFAQNTANVQRGFSGTMEQLEAYLAQA